MAEYIEREEALNRLCQENCGHNYVEEKCNNCYTAALLEYIPAADVAPVVHGLWIHDINNLYGCSECMERETMSPKKLKPYCPNCGARMDGDTNG